jgi:drug/metabolite transporter, DME family
MLVISGHASGASAAGVVLALFASFCYAVYAVTASYLITNGAGDRAVVGAIFGGDGRPAHAGPVHQPHELGGDRPGPGGRHLPRRAHHPLAYLLSARGMRTTAVTTATTLGLAEPAVAAVLGLAVLSEHLTITGLAGLGVLAVGLVIAAWPARRPTAVATSDRALGQPQKGATPSGVTSTPSSG